jgi:hypothetical protein
MDGPFDHAVYGHQPSRRAVSALQGMMLLEELLHVIQPLGAFIPSRVRISAPSVCTASRVQERAGSPSITMVQAPQAPSPQATFRAVRPRWSRKKSLSRRRSAPRFALAFRLR